jgi:hypothetical protein
VAHEQKRFLDELRTKLDRAGSDIGDKLGIILTETSSRIISERASLEARLQVCARRAELNSTHIPLRLCDV